MAPMMDPDPVDNDIYKEQEGFVLIQHGHRDMVEATAFNHYGTRFASGSVDGKIKVYNRHRDGSWVICDTWGAHNSEILEIQWLPPTLHPNLIASIGSDGKFKLWVEDPTLPPGKGRRFNSHNNKPVWQLAPLARAPYLSFAIKHNPETRHTYIALINRNATLIIYENEEPENMENWVEVDKVNIPDKPTRGDEVSFKVAFDPNLEPCYKAVRQGVQRDSLAVIVASMNKVSIWRTKEISHSVSLGSSSSKELYCAADLKGHKGLVRDVAWAPGSIRGFDIVATACRDGFVRVFHLTTPAKGDKEARSKDFTKIPETSTVVAQRSPENTSRSVPSGIGAGLASTRPGTTAGHRNSEHHSKAGEVALLANEVSRLETNRTPVWRVEFDGDGKVLGSTGDDGKVAFCRSEPSGAWSKSAELGMTRSPPLPMS
ncbi:hypothetical protein HYALB_00000071 [Hymenoscyphus albidus]|uniref:WD40 repeat-like protein n=1 Tax=Hymenoscyphus albidus TaxID=595503 RepID=A0A9N9LDQ4_9HELO|nr:hypothetical protein HYALB_00000071 [Hymenoscyphus albidus]